MKKIHITEAQLNYIKSKLTEAVAVDATKEVEAKGGNVNAAWQDMKSKNPSLSQQADDGEVSISVNPKGIDEGVYESNRQDNDRSEESEYMENMGNVNELRKFTKRQIKEAKIRKLRKSCERFTKKDLK